MRWQSLIFAAALLCARMAVAQGNRGPSTAAERARALAAIGDLEQHPLGDKAQEERSWLLRWLTEVPDVHVLTCIVVPGMSKGNNRTGSLILFQMMAGGARYAIEHKDEPDNPVAQFQAGVRSGLRAYEMVVAANPSNRQAGMEEVLQLSKAGELDAWVAQRVATVCMSAPKGH
ncbi:hypothetical protein SAMN05421819_1831 [Bryocella elongata]|uniref:Uncharacterized protein n=1 Tax=Bryocella elongata TaxID=863522 RepID=A0A1H5X177_9BACT|nr:hypothetical protein [Bryocella elongata]SEG05478.1 hypothetical protein SAMN05421819_1831 [Bryocella elongata]